MYVHSRAESQSQGAFSVTCTLSPLFGYGLAQLYLFITPSLRGEEWDRNFSKEDNSPNYRMALELHFVNVLRIQSTFMTSRRSRTPSVFRTRIELRQPPHPYFRVKKQSVLSGGHLSFPEDVLKCRLIQVSSTSDIEALNLKFFRLRPIDGDLRSSVWLFG